jgi:hypothetical protein
MTCQEFGLIARDYVRAEWLSAGERERAASHVSQCAVCQSRVDGETALTTALGQVRMAQESIEAPQRLNDALMTAFDARHARVPHRWKHLYWAIPAAAAILVGIVLSRSARVEERPLAKLPETRVVLQPAPQRPAAIEEDVEPAVALRTAPRRTQPVRAAASSNARVTEFIPLRFGKPVEAGEQIQVFRMQMRRSELMRLGLPVAPDAASAYIQADVLLGEDGLAKAIRFVY